MAIKKWQNDHLEGLLKSLPTINDRRPRHILYQNIYEKMNQKRRSRFVIATISTAVVMILILIWKKQKRN